MFFRPRLAESVVVLLVFLVSANLALAQRSAPPPIAPFQAGNRLFFVADSGTLYVRDYVTGPARALLPPRTFATLAPSRDGRYLAYSTPLYPGMRSSQVRIRDVTTRRDLSDVLASAIIASAPWTDNHQGFFYTREDTADHRERVYYHRVGQNQARDQIIYSRQDHPDWRYDARVSDDGQYAVFTISHAPDDRTRLYFIDLDDPGKPTLNAPMVKLVDEFSSRYTFIDNAGTLFFLQTDRAAPNGRIVMANTDVIREDRWTAAIRELADTLRFVRTAGNEFVIPVYRNGNQWIARVYSPPSANQMRDEARRRMDSARKASGDTVDRGRDPRGGRRDRGGYGGRTIGDPGALGSFWLELRRDIPIPADAEIADMRSLADKDEVYYTIILPDHSTRAYVFNVRKPRTRWSTHKHGKRTPMTNLMTGAWTLASLLRSLFTLVVGILAILCLLDWLVRTRRINPFNPIARFMRGTFICSIAPMERRVVRAGGLPSAAPWWTLALVVVAGILVITAVDFISQQIAGAWVQLNSGPRGLLVLLVSWTFLVLRTALLVRVIVSWLPISPFSRWVRWAFVLTEPILQPLRAVIPTLGMFDITPLVAYFLLGLLERLFLGGGF